MIARIGILAQFVIACVWIYSGISKVIDPEVFRTAVEAHGLLPSWIGRGGIPLGVVEVFLGFGVVAFGRQPRLIWAASGASFAMLAGMTVYLTRVPEKTLASAGCGCRGRATQTKETSPATLFMVNGLLLAAHVPACLVRPKQATTRVDEKAEPAMISA